MSDFYKQCTLRSGETVTVSWIEEYAAKVGNRVTLKDSTEPKRLWLVESVAEMRMEEKRLQVLERQHLKHREVSDI